MPPWDANHPHVQRSCRTGTARSLVARADGPASRSTVPATVWAPPPDAIGERWRVWLLSAIDRAFLPAHGRRVDLTAHLVDQPHNLRLPAYGQGPGEGDGDGRAAGRRSRRRSRPTGRR